MHATNSRDLQEWQQVFEEYKESKEKGVEYTQWVSNKKLHRPYFKNENDLNWNDSKSFFYDIYDSLNFLLLSRKCFILEITLKNQK